MFIAKYLVLPVVWWLLGSCVTSDPSIDGDPVVSKPKQQLNAAPYSFVANQTLVLDSAGNGRSLKAQVASSKGTLQIVLMEPGLLIPLLMLRGGKRMTFEQEILKEDVFPKDIEWEKVFNSIYHFYGSLEKRGDKNEMNKGEREFEGDYVRYIISSRMNHKKCPSFPKKFLIIPKMKQKFEISGVTDKLTCPGDDL